MSIMKKTIDLRFLGLLVILVALISFAIGVEVTNPATGAAVVFSSGTTWVPSSTDGSGSGITFAPDTNTICFPTSTGACDHNVDWNGTDLILQTP